MYFLSFSSAEKKKKNNLQVHHRIAVRPGKVSIARYSSHNTILDWLFQFNIKSTHLRLFQSWLPRSIQKYIELLVLRMVETWRITIGPGQSPFQPALRQPSEERLLGELFEGEQSPEGAPSQRSIDGEFIIDNNSRAATRTTANTIEL